MDRRHVGPFYSQYASIRPFKVVRQVPIFPKTLQSYQSHELGRPEVTVLKFHRQETISEIHHCLVKIYRREIALRQLGEPIKFTR